MSFIANHFFWRDDATPPFMLELPDYKLPQLRSVAIGLYTRAMMFLKRAGTTIFSMMVLIWFLASFPRPPEGAAGPAIDYSLAAIIGKWLEPLTAPVGFNWQINVALIPGMAAREVAVASLGTVYAIEGGKEAAEQIGQALANKWSLATALALLAWYVFAPQCASTLAVIKRETGSWRWMFVTFGYMLALAYVGGADHLSDRRRARRGLGRGPISEPFPADCCRFHSTLAGRAAHLFTRLLLRPAALFASLNWKLVATALNSGRSACAH